MKVGRIDHERCGERDATTYVWVPDAMTRDEFRAAVARAHTSYQAAIDEWAKDRRGPLYVNSYPDFAKHPEKTVAEVQLEHAKAVAAYKTWEATKRAASGDFSSHLRSEGMLPLWDYDPELREEIVWGHQHGARLEYAGSESDTFRGPAHNKQEDLWS